MTSHLWLVILFIIGACTCGGKTECGNRAQISVLTSIHDDPSCRKLSTRGVIMFEAAKMLVQAHNNKSNVYELGLTTLDTCGSISGALKASMKALVWADISCLQPPHYLGIIGPDTLTNAEAVHKVTSVLKVPHIVPRSSNAAYLHHLEKESNAYLVQGVLKVIEALKWKSFTLVANNDDDNDDDVQSIAKKLTMSAIAKKHCVIIHDNGEEDFTSHIVHIGKPEIEFFSLPVNSTILIVSEGNLKQHMSRVNSTNTIVLLEDARNEFTGLEDRVDKSVWWPDDQGQGKYDAELLRDVRWLQDAINVYTKGLDVLCKKQKCKGKINPIDWNNVIANILETHNAKVESAPRTLRLSIKAKFADLEELGSVVVRKNKSTLYWRGQSAEDDDDESDNRDEATVHRENDDGQDNDDENDDNEDDMPDLFKQALSKEKEIHNGCASTMKEIKMLHEEDEEAAKVLVHQMDDHEWWTMVGTVSGVGVAMFVVGILAVYVVYSNIRGPRTAKNKNRDRDSSLRRVGSDRELPTTITRIQRQGRGAQRRDSTRSNISDKSV